MTDKTVCPVCGKKMKPTKIGWACPTHNVGYARDEVVERVVKASFVRNKRVLEMLAKEDE